MKPKKKREWVWCHTAPTAVEGFGLIGERRWNQIKLSSSSSLKIPSRVLCKKCGKKFKPRVRMCHDENCWHVWVPAHKRYI